MTKFPPLCQDEVQRWRPDEHLLLMFHGLLRSDIPKQQRKRKMGTKVRVNMGMRERRETQKQGSEGEARRHGEAGHEPHLREQGVN